MAYYQFSFVKNLNLEKIGYAFFLIGIFFLCSSLFISILFLLPSLVIGGIIQKREKSFFNDKWNCSFFLCSILILVSAILQKFFLHNIFEEVWENNLTIVGMVNWIPFFWLFWSFQPYLNTSSKRRNFAYSIVSGTFPLLITGFGQYFFNWTGPFETLNSLIIWYQKPIVNPGGLSGLFNHQNYAGSWLCFVWPFCIALILEKSENLFKKSFAIIFLSSIGIATFLTFSRNAWSGILIVLPIMIGQESIFWITPFLIIGSLIILYYLSTLFTGEVSNLFKILIPNKLLMEFSEEGYQGLDATRFEIFVSALKIINIRPLIGIGAASFSAIYALETGFFKGHSHNLITELAISYGLPVTIIFTMTLIILIIKSGNSIFFKNSNYYKGRYFDKACWASIFFFLISQLVDIQYFDGKISIVAWTLIASIKNILKEDQERLVKIISK